MQIPIRDEILLKIYQCGLCKRVFKAQVGPTRVTCAVAHQPGDCCHYYEVEIDSIDALQKAVASMQACLPPAVRASE